MKPNLLALPLLAVIGVSGCIVVVQTFSVRGEVYNLPNPDVYGPLTLQLSSGNQPTLNVVPESAEVLEVYPLGTFNFHPYYETGNPIEEYTISIVSQPNGYTCSFDSNNYTGTYINARYPSVVPLTCVAD